MPAGDKYRRSSKPRDDDSEASSTEASTALDDGASLTKHSRSHSRSSSRQPSRLPTPMYDNNVMFHQTGRKKNQMKFEKTISPNDENIKNNSDLQMMKESDEEVIFVNEGDSHNNSNNKAMVRQPSYYAQPRDDSPTKHQQVFSSPRTGADKVSGAIPFGSPNLMKLKAEQEEKEAEEQKRLEEVERANAGISMKRSGSFTLGDFPGYDASLYSQAQWYCQFMLESQRFDGAIGIVILFNSITIGIESSLALSGGDTSFIEALEHVFLAVYVLELGSRFFGHGVGCLKNSWVAFDAVLVTVGIASTWVLPIALDTLPEGLGPLLVLRVLRLLRLARAVRLLVAFRTLWMLVRGLLSSVGTMFYTFVLIFLILYVFGVLALEVITKDLDTYSPDSQVLIEAHFGNLFVTMMTLVQFVTLDSVGSIYVPLIKETPILAFYFMSFILIVSVALMNLVTAVIVEGAIEQAKADKEVQAAYEAQKLEKLLPELKEMFEALDEDGNGDLTRDEVENGMALNPRIKEELTNICGTDDPMEIFDTLDVDGGGGVTIDEFCEQIMKSVTSDRPIELERILKLVKNVPQLADEVAEKVYERIDKDRKEQGDGQSQQNSNPAPVAPREPPPALQGAAQPTVDMIPEHLTQKIEDLDMRMQRMERMLDGIAAKMDVGYVNVEYL